MKVPDLFVGKRLFLGLGRPELLGRDDDEVRGSGYLEGPLISGDPTMVSPKTVIEDGAPGGPEYGCGNVNVTQNANSDINKLTGVKKAPFYALFVKTYSRIKSFLKVDTLITAETLKAKIIYSEVIMANIKNFVIPHPSKEGKNLVYSCLEGPENGVYVRGTLTNKTEIILPDYWKDLVHNDSITVTLTPVGCHQDLIVKRVSSEIVTIQTQSPYPIHCFYHVYGERKDVRKLVTEVDIDASI
jgi:hypothetical protein